MKSSTLPADAEAARASGGPYVVISLRNGTVCTLGGPDAETLAAMKALRGAWHAGKTGGVDLWTDNWTTLRLQFDYEDIVSIEIYEGRR